MSLTKAERETIVAMDDAGDIAHVYTAQPRILGRLRNNPAAVLVEEGVHEGTKWARFELRPGLSRSGRRFGCRRS
jgi:hypothetical protein